MAYITHILGFLLLILWLDIGFLAENIFKINPPPTLVPLLTLLTQYKTYILGSSIVLIVLSFINTSKIRNSLKRNDERWQRNDSTFSREDSDINSHFRQTTVEDYSSNKEPELERDQESFAEIINLDESSKDDIDVSSLKEKVAWTPIASGGANFKTSHLYQPNQSRIEVLKSIGAKVFSAFFIFMGGVIPGFIMYELVMDEGFGFEVLGIMAFGLIFIVVGILMLFYPKPRVFDKQVGWFWAGSKSLNSDQQLLILEKSARLTDIAAIQIVAERLSGKNSSYTSWEINLVSHDLRRLNVMDHGNKKSIDQDAQLLSEFLDVPVWENT